MGSRMPRAPRAMVPCSGSDSTIGEAHVTEQQSLFGDMAADGGARTDGVPAPDAEAPRDARSQAAARAAELRHLLDYHAYRYYALDAPEITDAAFDKLLVELQQIEAAYPELVTSGPTRSAWAATCPSSSRLSRTWRACTPWTTP